MIGRRKCFGLALKPLLQVNVESDLIWKDFNGNCTAETSVGRLVNFSHAARANRGDDLVGTEARANSQSHGERRDYSGSQTLA